MCGFVGVLDSAGTAGRCAPAVGAALRPARHRGPDESDLWHDDDVVLGFNRLAVIDVERSHQPLHWAGGRYALVFNGEIYNYPELRAELAAAHGAEFATSGDTEVVVAAYHYWGPDAVHRLRGMFAFLIWDSVDRVLFGARDPFGIKPLYVASGPRGTAFASEKKSLAVLVDQLGGRNSGLDPVAVQDYVALQYVPEPATLHLAIRRLKSGTRFTLRPGGRLHQQRYFTPTFDDRSGTGPTVHARIAQALRDSVAAHMRADVTVGAFLSGGIDSTAIAALAKEHNPNLIGFSVGFDHEGYSEIAIAAESAHALGMRHVTRTVTAEEVAAALPAIIWYLDDPLADPALVPLWFLAREARKHVKVVLSGEGADELFAGYSVYREPLSLAPFEWLPAAGRRLLGPMSRRLPDGLRGKDLLRRASLPLEQRYFGNARQFRPEQIRAVLPGYDPGRSPHDITREHYEVSRTWDPVARMQHVDLFTWLRGDILVKADKMTMANSLELRVPFLDPAVFAVAAGLPRTEKLGRWGGGWTTKVGLRRALQGIVPDHVLHRPKLGFPVPVRHWLADELYPWARQIVCESGAGRLVDRSAVLAMLDAHRAGTADHGRRLWTMLVLLIWHGIFVEQRIQPDIVEPAHPVRV